MREQRSSVSEQLLATFAPTAPIQITLLAVQPESVRYEQINAMLLNEFLKEHRKVEELKNGFQATVAQQQKGMEVLTAQFKEQAAQIQKVNAQLEMSKPAPQVVNNP